MSGKRYKSLTDQTHIVIHATTTLEQYAIQVIITKIPSQFEEVHIPTITVCIGNIEELRHAFRFITLKSNRKVTEKP